LIVHRRSIVDRAYIKNTGDDVSVGSELVVNAEQFEADLALVARIGLRMIQALAAMPE
jgi:hypothetical protein